MRDPAVYFGLVFLVLSIQGLVWGLGRHSLELDWWRTLPFAFLLLFALPIAAALGLRPLTVGLCYAISTMLVWSLAGFFYEPERWQRLVMSAVLPVLGMVALPLGIWLRKTIFGW